MRPENNCIVIFGASGDLTRRKLIPALFHLFKNNQLPEKFAVLGVSRTELDDDTFREAMRRNLIEKEGAHGQTLEAFCTHLYYQSIDTADREDYAKLLPRLDTLHHEYETRGNTVYYLSTPPSLYGIIPECLAPPGPNDEEGRRTGRRGRSGHQRGIVRADEERGVDVVQKVARRAGVIHAVAEARLGVGDEAMATGSGEGHVEESPLLLDGARAIHRHL